MTNTPAARLFLPSRSRRCGEDHSRLDLLVPLNVIPAKAGTQLCRQRVKARQVARAQESELDDQLRCYEALPAFAGKTVMWGPGIQVAHGLRHGESHIETRCAWVDPDF